MTLSFEAFILVCSVFSGSTVSSVLLGRPSNVRLTSFNMNLVLKWDAPEGGASGLLYTAQFKSPVTNFRVGCVNVSTLECDLTSHHISIYGKYTGRVQMLQGSKSSAWVDSNPITMDKDTIIGPPRVSLISRGGTMEISIEDPKLWISDVRSVYPGAIYNVTYWKISHIEKGRSSLVAQQTRVTLNDLESWSEYCMQVQINTARGANPSIPSNVTCCRTTAGHRAPWMAPILVVLCISALVGLVVAVVMKWKCISTFVFPNDTLPQCLKETLLVPPVSTLKELPPREEACVQLLLMSEGRAMEKDTGA